MEPPKRDRLREIVRRLAVAPRAATAEEVFRQLSNIIEDVEDSMTSIPNRPERWMEDGRIYPPQEDNSHSVAAHPRVRRFRSLMHNTFVGENGAIEIQNREGTVEISKPGADGHLVWDLGGG